ncbi:MAG: hypothetical protein HN379_07080 [Desulfobacteraceae bacterium]|jgi:hypothetical protein|nr:hypothetical protein [Desulfobacteraceae bacterium]
MAQYKSYPYPVLGNSDDVGGALTVKVEYGLNRLEVNIQLNFELENPYLSELIESGRAEFVAKFDCPSTYYRQSFKCMDVQSIAIASEKLSGDVRIDMLICATEEILDYCPTGLHPDYGDNTFNILPGDVLALAGKTGFIAEKDFDPLRMPVGSIMQITQGKFRSGPFQVDFDCKRILITLSQTDWLAFNQLKGQATQILQGLIAFPVLVEAIRVKDNTDFSEYEWVGRIKTFLLQYPVEDDPIILAQQLLHSPSERALQQTQAILGD